MSAPVTVVLLEWHASRSSAFHSLIVEPLRPRLDVSVRTWDRTPASLRDCRPLAHGEPVVFCQAPPPPETAESPGARVLWAPMWDEARTYGDSVWSRLPRSVRIVAFSRAVAAVAADRGFKVLCLQYLTDPAAVEPAPWREGLVVYYWNRTGLFPPVFLAKLCRSIRARRILLRTAIDPEVSENARLPLPWRLGGAEVVTVPAALPRDEYERIVSSANVFLAPRACEGVGLMQVEATARGQAVFACDAPAMNEYIRHGEDGFLFALEEGLAGSKRADTPVPVPRSWDGIRRPNADLVPRARQDWRAIAGLDLPAIGARARDRHREGFAVWRARIPELVRFVLDW